MTPDRWSQIESLFTRAVELPPTEWEKFLDEALSRTYFILGHALSEAAAAQAFREGLESADRMLSRAPTSIMHQVDRCDVLEAAGTNRLKLASKPGMDPVRGKQLRSEARSLFLQSAAVWQDWKQRRVALPYAERRLAQAQSMVVSAQLPSPTASAIP